MDKHGNVIARPGSDKPFVLQVEGPGAMDLTLVELGNGVVEVQYEATLAGSYLLGVHVDGEPVADSPYVVLVDPASVKAPHTTAEFSKNVATAPSGEMDTVRLLFIMIRINVGRTASTFHGLNRHLPSHVKLRELVCA
jgi:hypothetical protein